MKREEKIKQTFIRWFYWDWNKYWWQFLEENKHDKKRVIREARKLGVIKSLKEVAREFKFTAKQVRDFLKKNYPKALEGKNYEFVSFIKGRDEFGNKKYGLRLYVPIDGETGEVNELDITLQKIKTKYYTYPDVKRIKPENRGRTEKRIDVIDVIGFKVIE